MSDDFFTAGDVIIVTAGEYSDYDVTCLVKALKDFTLDEIKRTPGCLCPIGQYERYARLSLAGLIAAGFVEELPSHREIWTGSC